MINDVTKVNPIYSAIEYWQRWKPYAHKSLHRYTNDPDIHGNLDYELYLFFRRAIQNFDYNRNVISYIVNSIRGLVLRGFSKSKGKYKKAALEIINESPLELKEHSYLDTTVDDYLMQKYILKYISRLDGRAQFIIKHYYGLDNSEVLTMVDMAKILKISPRKVRRIRERGIKKIRSILNNRQIYNMEDFINE